MIDGEPTQKSADDKDATAVSLHGLGDLAAGHTLKIDVGDSVVVGRSRSCDWSLRRTPRYVDCTSQERAAIHEDLAFTSVSRKHMRINYVAAGMVEVLNLAGNGTLVDGKAVDKIVLTDCAKRPHRIQLGPRGVMLQLLQVDAKSADAKSS